MNATKNILYDKDGNEFYPKTVTSNVYDEDGARLDNIMNGMLKVAPSSASTNITSVGYHDIDITISQYSGYTPLCVVGAIIYSGSNHTIMGNYLANSTTAKLRLYDEAAESNLAVAVWILYAKTEIVA